MDVRVEAIIPKNLFNLADLERVVENTLEMAAQGVAADYGAVTNTWHHDPGIEIERPSAKGRIVGSDDKPLFFLDEGTSVRYATMTPDFEPKTRPFYLGSYRGKGGLAFVNMTRPRPGIKARKFTVTIAKKWDKRLPEQMQRAIDSEVNK